jgi:hypothetical protein
MIRKAVAAFVAFMLGVTFAAVSASFHHRPEIESVTVELSIIYPNAPQEYQQAKATYKCVPTKGCKSVEERENWRPSWGWEYPMTYIFENSVLIHEYFKNELRGRFSTGRIGQFAQPLDSRNLGAAYAWQVVVKTETK